MSQSLLKEIMQLVAIDSYWESINDLESQLLYLKEAIINNKNQKNKDYADLEKQVQKYENEIRKHIRTEQQIKLYCEQLQSQIEEEKGQNVRSMIQQMKKEISILQDQNKILSEENQLLRKKLHEQQQFETLQNQQHSPHRIRLQNIDTVVKKQNTKFLDDRETKISNTIDTSILKAYYQKKEQEHTKLNQRTTSQQVKQKILNGTYELKSVDQTKDDNCKQFVTTYSILQNRPKVVSNNYINNNRQKRSISEHKQIKHKERFQSIDL